VRVLRVGEEEGFAIEAVLPRDNTLVRAGGAGGRRARAVAANLDRCAIVLPAARPPFRREVADRFLALVEICGVQPVLLLNKIDLPGAPAVFAREAALYRSLGYPVLATSARTGEGVADLSRLLSSGTSALVGPSGVGKSSLLNLVAPGRELRTAPVRRGGRGRQTTVGSQLIPLRSGGWVADTPGFSEAGLWGVDPGQLEGAFPEFKEPARTCRFRGCSHLHEPGCGVRQRVKEGGIAETRYASYRAMREEIDERPASYE
jgi:ribosome biogenesis GTPase